MAESRAMHDVAVWLARVAVCLTFVAAAVPKILDPSTFATDISNYQVFPYWSWNVLAGVVPMFELVCAVCLVLGWKRGGAALALAVLDVAFIALIGWVLANDIDTACGCFGAATETAPIGWTELWRDVALLAAIVLAARATGRELPAES